MLDWTQPTLSANGTMGGSNFSCACSSYYNNDSAYNAYNAFASGTGGNGWRSSAACPQWITFYNPKPLKIAKFRLLNTSASVPTEIPTEYKLQGSNDNSTWTDIVEVTNSQLLGSQWNDVVSIDEEDQKIFKYHRIYITKANGSTGNTCGIKRIQIVEAHTLYNTGDMYMWKGWKQPVMYANNTVGTITCSSAATGCDAYKAVDGVSTQESAGWATDNTTEGWWQWQLPNEIKISKIVFINRYSATDAEDVCSQRCQFYSGNMTAKMGPAFSVNKSRQYVTLDMNDTVTDSIYFYKTGGKYSGIGEIIIVAKQYKKIGSQVDLSTVTKMKAEGEPVVQMYYGSTLLWQSQEYTDCYRYFNEFAFDSNFTIGDVNASSNIDDCYKAFDDNTTTTCIELDAAPQFILWRLPDEVMVKQLTFKNGVSEGDERAKTVQFFADEARTIPLTDEFEADNEDFGETVLPVEHVITDKIVCYISDSYDETTNKVSVGEISMVGRCKYDVEPMDTDEWAIETEPCRTEDEVLPPEWSTWTQPTFTGYNTWGTVSATSESTGSGQYAWHALDGSISGGDESDFGLNGGTSGDWFWTFASALKISNIQIYNRANAGSYGGATTYTIYALESDLTTYTLIGTISLPATGWASDSAVISRENVCYGLKIHMEGSLSYTGIGEVKLTAQINTAQIISADTEILSNNPKTTRVPYVQPVLSSNGTLGGSSFAATQSSYYTDVDRQAFRATDPVNNRWQSYNGNGMPQWLTYYVPEDLILSSITFNDSNAGGAQWNYIWHNYTISASNDNSNWTTLVSGTNTNNCPGPEDDTSSYATDTTLEYTINIPNNETVYHYYRLTVNSTHGNTDPCMVSYMRLNGTVTGQDYGNIKKLVDPTYTGVAWEFDPAEEEDPTKKPILNYRFLNDSYSVDGVVIENGTTAIKKFKWLTSSDGYTYTSKGEFTLPDFAQVPSGKCNVAIDWDKNYSHRYHRFVVEELAGGATKTSLKHLIPHRLKQLFSSWNFVAPYTDPLPFWVTISNPNRWYATSTDFRSNYIGNSSSTSMSFILDLPFACILRYNLGVSSESGYDPATFTIDGSQIWSQSGSYTTNSTYNLSAGTHTLGFSYRTDGSNLYNDNCMKIFSLIVEKA